MEIKAEVNNFTCDVQCKTKFFEDNISKVKDNEILDGYIDFYSFFSAINELNICLNRLQELDFEENLNANFIKYMDSKIEEFRNYWFINNEQIKENLLTVVNNEVDFQNLNKRFVRSPGLGAGGRAPQNDDEATVFSLMGLSSNFRSFNNELKDFINNVEILKEFATIKGNAVIIGANGSGKSTLSRKLQVDGLNPVINIIPSQHLLYLQNHDFIIPRNSNMYLDINSYKTDKKLVNEEHSFNLEQYSQELHNLLNYLLNDHHSQKGDTEHEKQDEPTILEQVIMTFNNLLNKELRIVNGTLNCLGNDGYYDFNQMSDGERQSFYFIANVLSNESDGYIIIDEPENHLNPQISVALWDKLEILKPNSTFVYITHDPQFAVSRIDAQIVWSKEYLHPSNWEFEILKTSEIPEELLVEILGSKENVIFCEGAEDGEDSKIYSALYPTSKVKAVGGHRNVINYVKVINNMKGLHIEASGIIDGDGKSKDEINKFKRDKITVLPFNEIEMLLLSEEVINAINGDINQFGEVIDFEVFKEKFFEICEKRKVEIILNILKSRIDNKLETEKIGKSKNLEDLKTNFKSIFESIDLEEMYKDLDDTISEIIDDCNYEEMLKYCNLKNRIINTLMNTTFLKKENMLNFIIKNENLRDELEKKYFES